MITDESNKLENSLRLEINKYFIKNFKWQSGPIYFDIYIYIYILWREID